MLLRKRNRRKEEAQKADPANLAVAPPGVAVAGLRVTVGVAGRQLPEVRAAAVRVAENWCQLATVAEE